MMRCYLVLWSIVVFFFSLMIVNSMDSFLSFFISSPNCTMNLGDTQEVRIGEGLFLSSSLSFFFRILRGRGAFLS